VSNQCLSLVAPNTVNRTVAPTRPAERGLSRISDGRGGCQAQGGGKSNRHGYRDAAMILVTYRQGLRASELTDLQWDQVDFATATLHVRRAERGTPATHPIRCDEMRALRKLQHEQEPESRFVFTQRARRAFHHGRLCPHGGMVGEAAGFKFKAHPHMLRHACGFALANAGHDTRAGPPQYPAHGPLHRTGAGSVQGFLAVEADPTLLSAAMLKYTVGAGKRRPRPMDRCLLCDGNQRVPSSSPGAPTTQSSETQILRLSSTKAVFAAISRVSWPRISSLCAEISSPGPV